MSYLDTISRRLRFSVLVGIESAKLKGADRIIGKWHSTLREWPAGNVRTMSEEFLNCPGDIQSILHFTRKYGPLSYPIGPTRSFEFAVSDWREEQREKALWWDMFAQVSTVPRTTIVAATTIETIPRDQFQVERSGLTFRCANLLHFMTLEIASLPAERLRRCKREECTQRFVAYDLREKYCSESCKVIVRNVAKLRYWEANKQEFLAERRTQRLQKRRRSTNVTHKTR